MLLREWRESEGLTRPDVAGRLETHETTVFRWELEHGDPNKRIPPRDLMIRIFRLSRGAVTPNDFYDLPSLDQLNLPIGDDSADAPLLAGAR